jgi:hypothetical protein
MLIDVTNEKIFGQTDDVEDSESISDLTNAAKE